MTRQKVTIAHSPDSDDAFMFYGIASGATASDDIVVEQIMKDIQTLNEEAKLGLYDITAISFAAYPEIKDKYLLMPCGSSFGLQYGPIVLAKKNIELSDSMTVAIPGFMTTAYLLLRLYAPNVKVIAYPFQNIISAVQNGEVDAGLVIHEGQLTYSDIELKKIVALGQWWYEKTKLPLPLGGNAIKRDLSDAKISQLTKILKDSIVYALSNRQAALDYALNFARDMEKNLVDQYVAMYVNELSVDFGEKGRCAIETLFSLAKQAGLVEKNFCPEFV